MSSYASQAAVNADEQVTLHASIAKAIKVLNALIAQHAYASTRILFGDLRKQALTLDERQQIDELICRIPDAEQPVHTAQLYVVRAIEEAFNVNIETFNKTEFIAFARSVLTGTRKNSTDKRDRIDQTYLYRVVRDSRLFEPLDMVALAIETLKVRISRLEACDDEPKTSWEEGYLIEGSIGVLGHTGSASAFEEIAGIVDYCLERGYYRLDRSQGNQICPRRFDSLLPTAFLSLHDMFHEDIELGFSAQPRVQKWKQQLEDAGTDTYTRELLYKLIPFS